MKKSFRNLILSLLLAAGAAGLAACEGERGPVGEAGPTGTAGAAGPKGAAGDPGRSSDEIPSAYEFLKAWGKADGMAACSDDILNKKAPFPGPETLTKATKTADKVPHSAQTSPFVAYDNPATQTNEKGTCSNKVFAYTGSPAIVSESRPFIFTPTHGGAADKAVKITSGTTPVLRNPTQIYTGTDFFGGTFSVDLNAEAAEAEGMDRLAVRCDGRKRPLDSPSPVAGGKRVTGEYRIVRISGYEQLLVKDPADGLVKVKPNSGTGAATKKYDLSTLTIQVCIRFDSVPGTVKCLVKGESEKRNPRTDQVTVADGSDPNITAGSPVFSPTDDYIAFYKDGQFVRTAPAAGNFLPGGPAGGQGGIYFPFGSTSGGNMRSATKLCNLFDNGVVPCGTGRVPDKDGRCP